MGNLWFSLAYRNITGCEFGILVCLNALALVQAREKESESEESCEKIKNLCPELIKNATNTYPNYKNLTTPELIQRYGYPTETHNVTTEDGYILTAFRMPYSNKSPAASGKIPVMVMHGMMASSVQWVWHKPDKGLIYMLADAGYDVWICNARGTKYSRGHVNPNLNGTNPRDTKYWNFSFEEMGSYDLPAVIDYITNATGQETMYYIGHSIGTLHFYTGMSMRPEYNSRIRTMFSLSASGYIGHTTNLPFRVESLLMQSYFTEQLMERTRGGEMTGDSAFTDHVKDYCQTYVVDCGLCGSMFWLQYGFDPCQTDFTQLPGTAAHLPDTTSVRTFSHLAQNAIQGTLRRYDYTFRNNPKHYDGSDTPPDYDLSKCTTPVVIFYGDNDDITVPEDVKTTAAALGNTKEVNRIQYKDWTHMDNILGKDAYKYVYQPIIDIMNSQKYG